MCNDNFYIPFINSKVRTQGCEINRSGKIKSFSSNFNSQSVINKVIKIQKVFRGYITRKYIQEAKYIISKVKIIQNWWRNIYRNKKQKQNKIAISV